MKKKLLITAIIIFVAIIGLAKWADSDAVIDVLPVHLSSEGIGISLGSTSNYATWHDGWDGPGLGSADLTYYFGNGTEDIPGNQEWAEILRALNVWSKYAEITWTQVASSGLDRSIDIKWAVGDHDCGWPFSDPGGVLAHAFYPPPNTEPLAGDIHFNDAFEWSKIDLFSVALHECGHSLGLSHSDNPNAVMYQYGNIVTSLHQDDIDAIRSLYASTPTPTPTPTPAPIPPFVILNLLAGINIDPVAFNLVYYDGVDVTLPTGTEPTELIAVYYYDPVALKLIYYFPGWPSLMTQLEYGKVYLVIVSDACQWPIPQP